MERGEGGAMLYVHICWHHCHPAGAEEEKGERNAVGGVRRERDNNPSASAEESRLFDE